MKNVIIVESPSKSKTIESYMGSDYKVLSSIGHIRDLATTGKEGLGVDIEKNFEPNYKVIKGKEKIVKELKSAIKNAHVYLATDPDREGEAISYHLKEVLGLTEDDYERIEFHEITKPAVMQAFSHPRKIDYDLVSSQETRRILDRIIGFKVSKLLQSKIKSRSAGRVQSVALKLVCDLEDEIEAFVSEAYYELEATKDDLKLDFVSYKGNKERIFDKALALEIKDSLSDEFEVKDLTTKPQKRNSKPAYTTSTLQQDASNKLNYQASRTMRIAQSLYEGKEIGGEHVGLITYMRTDSTRLSDVFVAEALNFIEGEFGKSYLGQTKTKAQKLAQDAHEAIRPTSVYRSPESVKRYLTHDEYTLYKLIYNRTIASLMAPALFMMTRVDFKNNDTLWKLNGQKMEFDGFLRIYGKEDEDNDNLLPSMKIGEKYSGFDVNINELFTKPKSRYTEASLIKDMEELGIGRPSTYAQTLTVLKEREYINVDKKSLIPTEQGRLTNKVLAEYFSKIINIKYTAQMETNLDKISRGEYDSKKELKDFYDEFAPLCDYAWDNMEKIAPKLSDELCPECGAPLAFRKSRYGEFLACSNYPKCKYIKQEEKEELEGDNVDTGIICPKCGEGHIMERIAKTGRNKGNKFFACSNFPKCRNLYSDRPTNEHCPKCGALMLQNQEGELYCSLACDDKLEVLCPKCHKGHLVKRQATRGKNKGNFFYSCDNFPRCRAIYNEEPTNEQCPECNEILFKDANGNLVCKNEKCKSYKG